MKKSIIYRHLRRRLLSCNSVSLPVIVASILFGIAFLLENPVAIVINLLYFIIILEVTRMVDEYIRSPDHRVKIRYLVDAAIIASLREIIIIVVDSHHLLNNTRSLEVYGCITLSLMVLRYISMKISPDLLDIKFNKSLTR